MKNLLRLLLKSQHQRNRVQKSQKEHGMTLIELLIGTVMAFLIITPMLGFVVDMLNTDRREQIKANTEQDIQAAVDFIAQDLSQAIYIYDNAGITAINSSLTPLPTVPNGTPILVFWKRQLREKALPRAPIGPNNPRPSACDRNARPGTANECNDTYVLSLVAYYQIKDRDATWCQPSGGTGDKCPTRIARHNIRDGLKDPRAANSASPYYPGEEPSLAYNPLFDINKPVESVTRAGNDWASKEVLVNYIDPSDLNVPPLPNCQIELGVPNPAPPASAINAADLLIANPDKTNSFYACVDTSRNLARVTIRGNSQRRLQPNNADYNASKSAFFPTATVQVQGRGARGE